jgi:hypothetical protein
VLGLANLTPLSTDLSHDHIIGIGLNLLICRWGHRQNLVLPMFQVFTPEIFNGFKPRPIFYILKQF